MNAVDRALDKAANKEVNKEVNKTTTDKTATFIIPAYNSADTLARCLDSFLDPTVLNQIEVIVVNDGSTDETMTIAQTYTDKHPSFRLINKENAGHGSVINCASKIAEGKFFKVVDSDDRVLTQNLPAYITSLQKSKADVVLTHFQTLDCRTGFVRKYQMRNVAFGNEYSFDEFWKHSKRVYEVFQLHGITYRTGFYQSRDIQLSERISYEDQEYSTLPFAAQPTVLPLDLTLEEYSLGNPGQSMSDQNLAKNLPHLEAVLWKIEEATASYNLQNAVGSQRGAASHGASESNRDAGTNRATTSHHAAESHRAAASYFLHKRREVLLICFVSAMLKSPDRRSGRQWARFLYRRLKAQSPTLYRASRKQYFACLLLSFLGIRGGALMNLQKFRLYRALRRLLL